MFLFLVNLWICGRLLHTEYLDQMGSIEGAFISMASYIQRHWPGYDWFPVWFTGFPFSRVYQPGLHYSVAALATVSGLSVPSAYHILVALTYSLGAVAFYWLALVTGGSRRAAFFSALVFSVFSPSVLVSSAIRGDVGGFFNPRRLQALVFYGEGPNVTGLALAMVALAAIHLAQKKKTALSGISAAIAVAVVPATSWPATMALLMGILAYLAAQDFRKLRAESGRLVLIGLAAWGFASPFALPSTILATLHGAGMTEEPPTAGSARWIAIALLIAALLISRAALLKGRVSWNLRFALLWSLIAGWVVLAAIWMNIRIVPQPARFHLAMEIAFILAAGFLVRVLLARLPEAQVPLAVVLLLLCAFQARNYRRYARSITHNVAIANTIEFQEARWFEANVRSGRVMVPGSISFWMNIFTDTPQMTGCCDQSLSNTEIPVATWPVQVGYRDNPQSADYTLLWLKAFDVSAFAIGGKQSHEYYKAFLYPERFKDRLPVAWQNGDDRIYSVPERSPTLARIVPADALVKRPPLNGIDVAQLRVFVAALDNPVLPLATFEWKGPNNAKITGALAPNQAVEVPISYDRGWTASANGKPVPVMADGLGFLAFQPHCDGPCAIQLKWSPGIEPLIAWAAAIITLIGAAVLVFRERRRGS